MASRVLRSRTVKQNQENTELLAGESKCDRPSDQPEGLGSVDEQCELTVTSQLKVVLEPDSRVLPAGHLEARKKHKRTPIQRHK
jgi:hypothetical protein